MESKFKIGDVVVATIPTFEELGGIHGEVVSIEDPFFDNEEYGYMVKFDLHTQYHFFYESELKEPIKIGRIVLVISLILIILSFLSNI